jgi:hypothetical protein
MLRTDAAGGTRGLVIEMTDGTSQANAQFRRNVGFYYDLVTANVERIVTGLSAELQDHPVTVVSVTPGWPAVGEDARELRRHRGHLARRLCPNARLRDLRVAGLCRQGCRRARHGADAGRWAGVIVSARQLADAYGFTDIDGSKPDCWGYLAAYAWEREDGEGIDNFR